MGRNRVIYQSEALFVSDEVGSTSPTDHDELIRVQGANYGFTINRTDVNQFGNLARIDSLVLEPPTVNFDFSYYLSNGKNEKSLGFSLEPTAQFVSGFLEASSGKNFYIVTSDEGQDATTFENSDPYSLIGIGNAFLTDYTIDLSVGSLPTASVSFEASNINSQNGNVSAQTITGQLPSIKPEDGTIIQGTTTINIPANTGQDGPTALRPGDIELSFPGFEGGGSASGTLSSLSGAGGFHVQSASISIPLSRSPISRLGSKFPYARVVDFPVNATMNVNAILNTVEAGNLAKIIAGCGGTESTKNVSVTLKDCDQTPAMSWTLKGATLDSESFSSSIGSNKSVDLTFGVQIGGIDDIDQGIIFSGAYIDVLPETIVYDVGGNILESFEGSIPENYNSNNTKFTDPSVHSLYIGSTVVDISGGAFSNNNDLSGILTIPKNVRYIGVAAFTNTNINGLIIENGVTGIGDTAFRDVDCEINLPESLTSIGSNAFNGNTGVTYITFPSNLVSVGNDAFSFCDNLSGIDLSNVSDGSVFGYSFRNNDSLAGVTIPDHWTTISYLCFGYAQNLEGLYLGTGLTTIGQQAFDRCGITGTLQLPPNLVAINQGAFQNGGGNPVIDPSVANVFTGIDFPLNNTLETIGDNAFYRVRSIKYVNIPDSVSSVGTFAFSDNNSLTGVVIGSGVTSIDSSCFNLCIALTGVTINCPTESWVGTNAFGSTPSGIYTITGAYFQDYTGSSWSGDQGIAAGSVYECYGDGCPVEATPTTVYDLNDQLLSGIEGDIPDNWHDEFSSPTTDIHRLEIGSTVENVGFEAFDGNTNLSGALTIPSNVRYISGKAFNATKLNDLIFEEGITGIGWGGQTSNGAFSNITTLENINLPNTLKEIPDYCFYRSYGIKNITISDSVKNIGRWAFTSNIFGDNGPVQFSIESIEFGTGLTGIGNNAFYSNFYDGGAYTGDFNLPSNLKKIGNYAFAYRSSITGLILPDGLEHIDSNAFEGVTGALKIKIPSSVTYIGTNTFRQSAGFNPYGANGVPEIEINCPTGSWQGTTSFNQTASGIYRITGAYFADYTGGSWSGDQSVPGGSVFECFGDGCPAPLTSTIAYSDSAKTIEFSSVQGDIPDSWMINSGISGVTFGTSASYIGANAFNNNDLLEVDIPNNITGIGGQSFRDNRKITGINLGDGLLQVGATAFREAGLNNTQGSIVNIDFGNSVEYIGNSVFFDVDAELTLPNSITGIGPYAFNTNNAVTNLYLPDSLKRVETFAFNSCTGIKTLSVGYGTSDLQVDTQAFNTLAYGTGLNIGPKFKQPNGQNNQFAGFGQLVNKIYVQIDCPTGSWSGANAFFNPKSGVFKITGAYFADYTGSSWSGDQGIAAGSVYECYGNGCPAALSWNQLGDTISGESAGVDFGRTLSMTKDAAFVLVGDQYSNEGATQKGFAKLYENVGGTWTNRGPKLIGSDNNDELGSAVAIANSGLANPVMAIGARDGDGAGNASTDAGDVQIKEWNGSSIVNKGNNVPLYGDAAYDYLGSSASFSADGSILALGAPGRADVVPESTSAGFVGVYQWNTPTANEWNQMGANITGGPNSIEDDEFGYSVALSSDGTHLIVGARYNDAGGTEIGAAYVYQSGSPNWTIKGNILNGQYNSDYFGTSVSVSADGTYIAVGAPNNNAGGNNAGHVRLYNWSAPNYALRGTAITGAVDDLVGSSVSISDDGNTVAIGAPGTNRVRVYGWGEGNWEQLGEDITGAAGETFGQAVSLSSDGLTVAVGAPDADVDPAGGEGNVRIFTYS